MLKKIFPYIIYLHIFQLDEYNPQKLIIWVLHHYFVRETENKKPLIWTPKAKMIYYFSIVITILMTGILTFFFKLFGFIIGVVFATQAYIPLMLSYFLLLPLERYQKRKIKRDTEKKIQKIPRLRIIGITGSYGKTSMKEFLYHILKTKYKVLKTPESYNTPYGIAKVVNYELNDSYDYFICEMGAYRRGEIKEICDMIHPQYGILTGINEQHLESFGSLQNTILEKFELIDALPADGFGIINGDNDNIVKQSKIYKTTLVKYGFHDKTFTLSHLKTNTHGSTFTLVLNGKSYTTTTKLIGTPNIQNILGAATMSYKLGIKPEIIVAAIETLKPVPHRLEIKEFSNMTLIDNAYNSNVDGFKASIKILTNFTQPTIFITPGIVDLGKATYTIHKELGSLLNTVDYLILVGKSERTKGLYDGLQKKEKAITIDTLQEVWQTIEKLKLKHPVILLENDLPDNY
jgi:UDP-N-acetylmuramoyl-tripeptide--D-alanyl-D-alanine ligase